MSEYCALNPRQVFLRDATGLVRGLSGFDIFIASSSIIGLTSTVNTILAYLGLFPGADYSLVMIIGLIPAIATVTVYSIQSAAFPRSGGDYIWVSRIAGPRIAFMFSWMLQFSYAFWVVGICAWFAVWMSIPALLAGLGITMQSDTLIQMSYSLSGSPSLGFLLSAIMLTLAALVTMLGVRVYSKVMRALWVYMMVGTVAFVGLLLANLNTDFRTLFDSMSPALKGATYDGLITAARNANLLTPFSVTATLIGAIPVSFAFYAGFNYTTYMSGEVKNVKRSMPLGLLSAVIFNCAFIVGTWLLCAHVFGYDFLYAVGQLAAAGSPAYTFPFGPTIIFFVAMLTNNPLLLFIVVSAVIVNFFLILPPFFLAGSRILFAWSYDRIAPTRLASVNDRFHSPIIALIVCLVANIVWAGFTAFGGFYASFMNLSLMQGVGWAIPSFVAALFPYMKKELYERTVGALPKMFSRKVAGVPILTIFGIIEGLSMLFYGYSLLVPTLTFTQMTSSVTYAIAWLVFGVVSGLLYVPIVFAYRKRQGLDLHLVYAQIPPE